MRLGKGADERPLGQSGPSECPLRDVALTASVSATEGVPQNDHAVALDCSFVTQQGRIPVNIHLKLYYG